jgi:hypothetical protein
MDATAILNRAIAILRQGRVLWIFAFAVALFEPAGSIQFPSSNIQFRYNPSEPAGPIDAPDLWAAIFVPLIAFGVLLLVFGVASFFLAPLARGGLFATTDGVAAGNEPSFGEALGAAARRYGSLLLVQLLGLIVPIVLAMVIAVVTVPLVVFIASLASDINPFGRAPAVAGIVVFGILFFFALFALVLAAIVVTAVVQAIIQFASLRLVVDGGGAGEAVGIGWALIREHAWTMLVVLLGFGVLTSLAVLIVVFPLGLVALVPFTLSQGIPPLAPILGILLIAFPLMAAVLTPVQALRYATFNVLYRDWTASLPES